MPHLVSPLRGDGRITIVRLNLQQMPSTVSPIYESVEFTGKHIQKGLYKTADGLLINADVNGSYNIMRKALPKALSNGIESCVVQPVVNPLKVKVKGEGFTPPMSCHR